LGKQRKLPALFAQDSFITFYLEKMMIFRIKNLIQASQTNESVSVFEEITAPGFGPPLHNHRQQLEDDTLTNHMSM
jgi:hypothetical protein